MTLPALSLLWSLSLSALVGPAESWVDDGPLRVSLETPRTVETALLGARAVFPSGAEILLLSTLSTASNPGDAPFFKPRSQLYALELRALPLPALAVSLRHSCVHPVLSGPPSVPAFYSSETLLTVSIGSPSLLRGPRP